MREKGALKTSRCLLAGRAQAGHLDNVVLDGEAEAFCVRADQLFDLRIFDFRGVPAGLANEKNACVLMVRMAAGDIGVAALDPGGDALFAQEIERSIDTRGGEPAARCLFEPCAQIISAERSFRRPQRGKNGLAQRRDLRAPQSAGGDGCIQTPAPRRIQIR